MISVLNRKKLLTDTSAIQMAQVRTLLDQAKIPYAMKTVTSRNVVGRMLDVKMYSQINVNRAYGKELTHVYSIYVRRKDYTNAKRAASL